MQGIEFQQILAIGLVGGYQNGVVHYPEGSRMEQVVDNDFLGVFQLFAFLKVFPHEGTVCFLRLRGGATI